MRYFLLLLLSFNAFAIKTIRSEVNRFRLLKDKNEIERNLIARPHSTFFLLDLNISSGLKSFIAEIDSSTSKEDETQKQTGITEVLSKYVNTERFLEAHIESNIPLPFFKYNNYAFLPTLFGSFYAGTSLSINNQDDPTAPVAQVYLQKNINIGVNFEVKKDTKKDQIYQVALYKRSRADVSAKKNAQKIATDDDVVSLDEIKKNQNDYVADIGFKTKKKERVFLLEVKELKLMDAGSEIDNTIGNAPLLHFSTSKEYLFEKFKMNLIYGIHHRQKYSLFDGTYIASSFDFTQKSPIQFLLKANSHFLSFNAGVSFRYFNFRYGYRTPLTNPRDEMWVAAQHHIHLNIPF